MQQGELAVLIHFGLADDKGDRHLIADEDKQGEAIETVVPGKASAP